MKIPNSKFQISNFKRGFTFIELILYISIVTIMLSAIIPFAWNVIGSQAKSSIEQEVNSAARYISERLKYEIRNAKDIDADNSNFDINLATDSTKKLTLVENTPINSTVIKVSSLGNAQITQGTNPAVGLNSIDTRVTDLTFSNYSSSDGKSRHIGFTLTVIANLSSQRQEFQEAITLRASSELRNN